MPGQNNRYLAQAELPCNMPHAPKEIWSYELGRVPIGSALCADVDDDGELELLYGTFPLVCVSLSGKEKWRCACGEVYAITDFDDDGHTELMVGGLGEHEPLLIRGTDGQILWQRTGPGEVGGCMGRYQAAKLLAGVKGQQIACVTEEFGTDSKIAQVWSFADGCRHGKLVWERRFAPWEHSALTVGRLFGDTLCLISPTWGGLIVMDAHDGKDLMRLYWEEAPGKSGLRNYGPLFVRDLDGDGQSELVLLAPAISQHIDVFAPWRGGAGEHGVPAKPWPAPHVPLGGLASYPDGPMLWRRFFGTTWPQDDFLIRFPAQPIADVDGDGKQEIIALVGKEQWELKVYDGMTGVEKLSLPEVAASATVFDLDDDGIAEIAVTEKGALVIGSLHEGRWRERARLEGCRLWHTGCPVRPEHPGDTFRVEQRPVALGVGKRRSWIATRAEAEGRAAKLVLLRAEPGAAFSVTEYPLKGVRDMQILAATPDRLIASTNDGHIRVVSPKGKVDAQWVCGAPFVSQPAVADIDGDGANEVVVCKAGGKVTALRASHGRKTPKALWEVDGYGLLTSLPAPLSTPLIADVDGDGKGEILVVGQGTRLLDCHGKTLWKNEIPAFRATFGDFNGDGHLDVYLTAWAPLPHSIGTTVQSFALDGRNGKVLWHNDGSAKIVWHHQLGPQHRLPTVFDVNGDGCDDVLFLAMDLLVELNGKDGSFLYEPVIANEIWKQQEGKNGQWTAYGTQIPVDLDGDGKLEILLAASWGQWGAWTMDRKLLWTFNPDKAQLAQRHPGIGDVDGDGKLEIGVIHDGGLFRCYDATTGLLKWELAGIKQRTDVVTADIDGDGLPEFLAGLAAFKPLDQTHGKVVWEADALAAHSPVVADVDGDGLCEIVIGCTDGKIRVYQ
jgi:outer membrane protein assembly factor BamB